MIIKRQVYVKIYRKPVEKGENMYSILVCDDEKDIVSALKIYLMADGYQVFEAYNGKEALEVVKGTGYSSGTDGYHDARDGWDCSDGENP